MPHHLKKQLFFFKALDERDTAAAFKCVFQHEEYISIYPFTKKSDKNPNSPAFIAGLFSASNRKHLHRWLHEYAGRGLSYSRFTIEKQSELISGLAYYSPPMEN